MPGPGIDACQGMKPVGACNAVLWQNLLPHLMLESMMHISLIAISSDCGRSIMKL